MDLKQRYHHSSGKCSKNYLADSQLVLIELEIQDLGRLEAYYLQRVDLKRSRWPHSAFRSLKLKVELRREVGV